MKHPILCVFLSFMLIVSTAHPFMESNASELWNSSKKNAHKKGKSYSYYNRTHTKGKTSGFKLYNSKTFNGASVSQSAKRSFEKTYNGYKHVGMTVKRKSDLWKFMSKRAQLSRQSDVDNALQIEYETRLNNAKHMRKALKEVRKDQKKAALAYERLRAEYNARLRAEEAEKAKILQDL